MSSAGALDMLGLRSVEVLGLFGATTVCVARGSIVDFEGDCIVNAANTGCLIGGGVDGAVAYAGGKVLQDARKALPILNKWNERCLTGDAKITVGGNLKATFVVHAVGPDMNDDRNQRERDESLENLRSAYSRALDVASEHNDRSISSIAFSLLSSGLFRGSESLSNVLLCAVDALSAWLGTHDPSSHNLKQIILVGFNDREVDGVKEAWMQRYPPIPARTKAPLVSSRAAPFMGIENKSMSAYIKRFIEAMGNSYSAIDNPTGDVSMCVAENKLTAHLFHEKLKGFFSASPSFSAYAASLTAPPVALEASALSFAASPASSSSSSHSASTQIGFSKSALNYTSSTGLPDVRETLASFMRDYIFKDCDVKSDQIVLTSGCCSVLHQLALLLFEPGDSVLVPTPYYPAFDHDFKNLGGVQTVEVNCVPPPSPPPPPSLMSSQEMVQQPIEQTTSAGGGGGGGGGRGLTLAIDADAPSSSSFSSSSSSTSSMSMPSMYISIEALEEAFNRTNESGHPVKALLLTNPSNPLGQSYSLAQLEAAAAWAEEKGIHLICDEIYALSGFGEEEVFAAAEESSSGSDTSPASAPAFCSMATLRARRGSGLGDHVHCLWSFSKDFGASGIRVGALYTHNKELLQAMDMCNNIMMVSNLAQEMCAFVVRDRQFVELFLRENKSMLRTAYHILRNGLAAFGIQLVPATSAIFAFADLRPLLKRLPRVGGIGPMWGEKEDYIEGAEEELEGRLLAAGLIFTPGRACHCQQPGFFRICYAWAGSIEAVHECVRRLGVVARQFVEQQVQDEAAPANGGGGEGGESSAMECA